MRTEPGGRGRVKDGEALKQGVAEPWICRDTGSVEGKAEDATER